MPLLIARKAHVAPARFLWRAQFIPFLVCAAAIVVPAFVIGKWMPLQPMAWQLLLAASATGAWLAGWAAVFRLGRAEVRELSQVLH
jgi:hypothetical protein